MTSFVSSADLMKEFLGGQPQEDSPIRPVHTPCKDCVFSERDAEGHQTGCSLGRIEKFHQNNPNNILEAFCLDEKGQERHFTIINGRFCNAHRQRGSQWARTNEGREKEVVREEIALRLAVLVYMGDDLTLEGLRQTAMSLKEQQRMPFQVFFINHQKAIKPSDIHGLLWDVLGNAMTWRISRIMPGVQNMPQAIDVVVSSLPDPRVERTPSSTYYTVVRSGFRFPPDFIARLDQAMNDDLRRFRVLRPLPDGNAGVAQVWLHKKWTNGWSDVIPVMEELAREHDAAFLIRDVREICPSCE